MVTLIAAVAITTTVTCGQIREYMTTYGRDTVIAQVKARGLSDKKIRDILRECKL